MKSIGASNYSVAQVGCIPRFNGSRGADTSKWFRNEKDRYGSITSLIGGWKMKFGLPAIVAITAELASEAAAVLAEFWAGLQKEAQDFKLEHVSEHGAKSTIHWSSADRREMFERMYFNSDGEIATPEHLLIAGYRRTSPWGVLIDVNCVRAKLGLEPILQLSYDLQEYTSTDANARHIEHMMFCIEENEHKFDGSLSTTKEQKLLACKDHIYDFGGSQAQARRSFKAGMGQFCWAACEIDSAYPEYGLIDKVRAGAYTECASLRADKLRKLLDQKESLEEVSAYLDDPKSGNNRKPIMTRKDIEQSAKTMANILVKAGVRMVRDNDKSWVNILLAPDVKADVNKLIIEGLAGIFDKVGRREEFDHWLQEIVAVR